VQRVGLVHEAGGFVRAPAAAAAVVGPRTARGCSNVRLPVRPSPARCPELLRRLGEVQRLRTHIADAVESHCLVQDQARAGEDLRRPVRVSELCLAFQPPDDDPDALALLTSPSAAAGTRPDGPSSQVPRRPALCALAAEYLP